MYIYIYAYTHIYIYTYTHIYSHTHTHIYIYIYIFIYIYICIHIKWIMCIYICVWSKEVSSQTSALQTNMFIFPNLTISPTKVAIAAGRWKQYWQQQSGTVSMHVELWGSMWVRGWNVSVRIIVVLLWVWWPQASRKVGLSLRDSGPRSGKGVAKMCTRL